MSLVFDAIKHSDGIIALIGYAVLLHEQSNYVDQFLA